MTCSNSIPAVLRRSKQAWSMVGARVVCSAGGARAFGAGWEGASAGRGGGNGGDAAVDALEACSGKASSAAIMKKARMRMCAQTIMASAGDRRNLFSLGVFIMDSALRSHCIYFSRRRLLCGVPSVRHTGQHSCFRRSEPVTAKSQPGDDAARRAPLDSGASNDLGCANPLVEGARAKIFVPPERPRSDRRHKGKPDRANEGRTTLLDDPTPTLQRDTVFCTRKAAERYRRIADDGGWAMIPKALGRDASANDVERLRQRLSMEGDLPQDGGSGDGWDDALTDAVTRFQRRAGLQQSGEVDQATLNELNVPADVRARELEASAKQIADVKIDVDQRYVVVNIPSASVEAVQDRRVAQRHAAVVGELDHQSPPVDCRHPVNHDQSGLDHSAFDC